MEPPRPVGVPECRCGVPAHLLKSRTEKNPNRWFFKCGACGYFKWADDLPGYPNITGGLGGSQPQHTPQRQTMQTSPQQQQPFQSPSIPRYQEASHAPQLDGSFSSPAKQMPAFGASGSQAGYAGTPHTHSAQQRAWQQQSPVQQPQWIQAQQSPAQVQNTFEQHSLMQPQQPGWHPQQQQSHMSQQLPPAAASQYPDIIHQPISTFGSLQQPHLQMQSPAGPAQFSQHLQNGSQGSQGAGSGGLGSQPQSFGSQQHFSLTGQQQGYCGAGGSPWQQQQQQYASPSGLPGVGYSQYGQQQHQVNSPARPGVQGMMGPAGGLATPGPQQQYQYTSPQPQQQAPPMSPGSGIVVTVVPPPENLPNHVGLKTPGYKGPFVTCMNSLDRYETDRHWEPAQKMWVVLRKSWTAVEQKLKAAGFIVRQGEASQGTPSKPLDMAALEASDARLIDLMSAEDAEETVAMANFGDLWEQLMPHQQEGVLAGVRRGGRVLLADEMGLGKTAQAILLACCYPDDWPLLVVVPASLRGVWFAELQAWIPPAMQPQMEHVHIVKSGQDLRRILDAGLPSTKRQIIIITYDLAKQIPANVAARFGVVICDESHHLKNKEALCTQAVGSLVRGAKRAMLLTGTPLLSRPIEAWSQVAMLRPGLLGSFHDYGNKYCTPAEGEGMGSPGSSRGISGGGRGFPVQPYQGCNRARADELHRLLLANVMVRRTKAQLGLSLPAKMRIKVSVPLDPAVEPRLRSIRSAMERLSASGQQDTPEGKRLINEYYRTTGEAKVAGVLGFILGLPGAEGAQGAQPGMGQKQHEDWNVIIVEEPPGHVGTAAAEATHAGDGSRVSGSSAAGSSSSSGGKLLVFAYHHEVLNTLQAKLCEAHNIGFVRIDGTTTPQQRQALVDRFQTDASVRIGLLSVKAAGAGLTLTAASRIVFAELYWNPTDLAQCEDRIHRVGQQSHCSVYYCMAANSADSLMWGTVVKKLKVVGATVDGAAGGSSAQGMAGMDSWHQRLSQHSPAAAATTVPSSAPAAAAAVGDGDAEASSGQQQQQSQSEKQHSSARPAEPACTVSAAATAKAGIRRRSLLDAFMEATESTGAKARQAAVGAPAHLQRSKPGTGGQVAAPVGSDGVYTTSGSEGGSRGVELAPARDAEVAAAAAGGAAAAVLAAEVGSIHSNSIPSTAAAPVVAAVTVLPTRDEQCSGLGDAGSEQRAAAKDSGGGSHAGSQAGHRAATQGSQSTIVVGEQQQPQQEHEEQAEGVSPDAEQPAKKQRHS